MVILCGYKTVMIFVTVSADFELRLSFRYHSGNSGVQVRTIDFEPFQSRGYQVEVAPQAKMGLWHHSQASGKYRSKLALAG